MSIDENELREDEVVEGVPFYAGMKLYKSGRWVYDITPEEQPYIDVEKLCHYIFAASFDRPNEDTIRKLKKTVADGLSSYATVIYNQYKDKEKSKERKDQIEKGISALLKAGALSRSPFHYFHAGQLAETIDDSPAMRNTYRYFLHLCREQNIQGADEAIKLAKQRLQALDEKLGLKLSKYATR